MIKHDKDCPLHCTRECLEKAAASYRSHAEALAKALERIKACYWATLGGKSVRDADEAFEEARAALSAYREGQKGQP